MKVTIKQIAEMANVSRSTVDKVLHNRPGVSDEVRQRIKQIADELGYRPNMIGKALAYQKKPLVIGIIVPEGSFFDVVINGIKAAYNELKDFGVKLEFYPMKNLDVNEQLNIIHYLMDKKILGLAIRPIDHPMIRKAINEVVDNGIPVVTFNSDIADSKRMCFVGQDLEMAGRVAGELMGKLLNGQGKIAIITGSFNILAHNHRLKGFTEVIKADFPDIKIIDIVETLEEEIVTFKKTLSLLETIKDLSGIYITAGGVSEVGKAIKIHNKSKDIKIISYDFYDNIVNLVKEGVIDFTIGQDPFIQGYEPVKILFEYLFNGRQPSTQHIKTKIDIRVKENIDLL